MPRGDGTGPMGKGPGTGRGRGAGAGQGRGGMGRQGLGGGFAAGPGGLCVCPKCGKTLPHQAGVPCNTLQCPDCKIAMTRMR
jgi:hypothetical protein